MAKLRWEILFLSLLWECMCTLQEQENKFHKQPAKTGKQCNTLKAHLDAQIVGCQIVAAPDHLHFEISILSANEPYVPNYCKSICSTIRSSTHLKSELTTPKILIPNTT